MITISMIDGLKHTDAKGALSWSHMVKMSRFGQLLAAILFLCLLVNGLIFVLRINGYSPVLIVADTASTVPKFQSNVQSFRTLQQSSNDYDGQSRTSKAPESESKTKGNKNVTEVYIDTSTKSTIQIVNPHDFSYLINEADMCKEAPELIIVVCTGVKNVKERLAIRDTWGTYVKDPLHKTKVVFLLGATDSKDMQKNLLDESNTYGDLVQENFHDSYRNLSLKSVAMLKWVKTYCISAKYLLKADDDMYINVPNLLTSLRKRKEEKFILGFIFVGARPVQDKRSKWYTPVSDFNEKTYPRYTSGTSYSMSVKAVPDLYIASQQVKLFWLEDIYITGLCARKAGVQQFHDGGFSFLHRHPTGCAFVQAVTGHDYKPEDLYKIHKELYSSPPPKC
ncbi:beta-1,3-galactosyltransferase 1-like isoform X2 [Haliotis rufescens]|uniref:beta-1,3-galactosyltransferase 1-like isoform X2 n=1 Tax=Haliotis rufescens TaxID=6454 RepID=UPI00201EF546|nr:beta-1,3-galactosyltransferase 1-like isoform X2 [Haliotis rufescens]